MIVDTLGGNTLDHQGSRAQALSDESGDACAELAVLLAQPPSELVAHALRPHLVTDELWIRRRDMEGNELYAERAGKLRACAEHPLTHVRKIDASQDARHELLPSFI